MHIPKHWELRHLPHKMNRNMNLEMWHVIHPLQRIDDDDLQYLLMFDDVKDYRMLDYDECVLHVDSANDSWTLAERSTLQAMLGMML